MIQTKKNHLLIKVFIDKEQENVYFRHYDDFESLNYELCNKEPIIIDYLKFFSNTVSYVSCVSGLRSRDENETQRESEIAEQIFCYSKKFDLNNNDFNNRNLNCQRKNSF